jgi:hypothetical protein
VKRCKAYWLGFSKTDRENVKARIRGGFSLTATDPDHPGMIVEIEPTGADAGYLEGRRFVPVKEAAASG